MKQITVNCMFMSSYSEVLRKPRRAPGVGSHRCVRRQRGSERGAALVEFALVLPIFLMVTFGMISFGFLINQDLELTEACNIGGEQLALMRTNSDPCKTVYTDVAAVSPHLTSANMVFTFNLNGTTYGPYTGSATTCTAASTLFSSLTATSTSVPVTLTLQYPPTGFSFFYKSTPFASAITLTAQITEVLQ